MHQGCMHFLGTNQFLNIDPVQTGMLFTGMPLVCTTSSPLDKPDKLVCELKVLSAARHINYDICLCSRDVLRTQYYHFFIKNHN